MPIARSYVNNQEVTNWTPELKEIPNQYGALNGLGLFKSVGIDTTTITFDRTTHQLTLPPPAIRGERKPSTGGRKRTDTFKLELDFYKHAEYITNQDILDKRMPGTQDKEQLGRVVAEKLELGRAGFDQASEYMKVQAIKGLVVDTNGTTLTNMFTEFGLTQQTINFELSDSTTDVQAKVRELKTAITKNARTGARTGTISVWTDNLFFDALKGHEKVREDFMFYQNSGRQILRDDLARYESYGIVSYFEFQGILFLTYDAEFNLANGTTAQAFEANTGYTVVSGTGNYKHFYGPSDKLSGLSAQSELYAFEYRDPEDEFIKLSFEAAPLILLDKPQYSVKVVAG